MLSLFAIFIFVTPSCTFDTLEPPVVQEFCDTLNVSYTNQMKTIIDTKCATPGCHIAGFSSGNFSTYDAMISRLESGLIGKRTVELKNMPPQGSPTLTEEELDIFNCWLSKDFPEN